MPNKFVKSDTILFTHRNVDAYEEKHVRVGTSAIPDSGEGLFMKVDVPKGYLASVMSGYMYR